MSAPTLPICPLGLTADDLSAWRDHALAPADERRITAHTGSCPACQQVIAVHEALAAALKAEQPPAPDLGAWSRLQARIAANPATGRSLLRIRAPRWRRAALLSSLSAVAAALVISALFLSLFSQRMMLRRVKTGLAATVTATPVVTPQPIGTVDPTTTITGPSLTWVQRALPTEVSASPGYQQGRDDVSFAASDAHDGYACVVGAHSGNPIGFWATHDEAATWRQVSALPTTARAGYCRILADAANPLRMIVQITYLTASNDLGAITNQISDDGGVTWRTIPSGGAFSYLVSRSGVSFAILLPNPNLLNRLKPGQALPPSDYQHLVRSDDGWRTWRSVDSALNARHLIALRVWQRPGDGALLAQADSTDGKAKPADAMELWQSVDLSATWTRIPTPTNLVPFEAYAVGQPQGTSPWRACGFMQIGSEATQSELIACTQDSGQTWQSRPQPIAPPPCPLTITPCAEKVVDGLVTPDGSLLYGFMLSSGATDLFRLAPGADHWQDLGPEPGYHIQECGAPAMTLIANDNMTSASTRFLYFATLP